MSSFIAYTLFGLFSGAAYAIAASGLVLTYSTTRVFNIAHGAFGMLLSFVFWGVGDVVRHELDARPVQAGQGRGQEVGRPLGVGLTEVVPGIVQAELGRREA